MKRIERLFEALPSVRPYAAGVIELRARISGTAFFPGGLGLWQVDVMKPLFPAQPVMILGHDFDSEVGFARSLQRGAEVIAEGTHLRAGPTWRNLIALLKRARVDPVICFFTNAFIGLREGSRSTGAFSGWEDPSFVDRCRQFLSLQLRVVRPRVILTLGARVPEFIAPLSPELTKWKSVRSLIELDRIGAYVPEARFPDSFDGCCVVAALTHPSLRNSNVQRRSYGPLRGDQAECQMIRDALTHANA